MGRKPKAVKDSATDKGMENNQIMLSKPSSPSSNNTASKYVNSDVRRSGRLQRRVSPPGNKLGAKEIDLTDNKKDEEERPQGEKINSHHSEEQETDCGDGKNEEQIVEQFNTHPTEEQISMEDKIDFLYQTAKELKAKAAKRPIPSATTSEDLNYKSLYIDSQKKIEALKEENIQLSKKLEYALGKSEAFEKMNDSMGKFKEMVVLTNLGQVTGTILNPCEDTQKKNVADKNPSQPKAAAPSLARDTNKKSCADTDAHNPPPQPKVAHTNASAATRNTKRKKISQ